MATIATIDPPNVEMSSAVGDGLSLLEQLAKKAGKRCKNPKAPILLGKDEKNGIALVHKTECKMWNCEQCGAKKARRAIARVLTHINTIGGQWYFMTVTAHEKWRGQESSHENFTRNWHKLRKRMRYQHGGHFDYFRTWEHHEDGTLHMHIITNCKLPYASKTNKHGKTKHRSGWLKRNARQCGMGFMTDYQPLENAGFAAHYVAKYMAKSINESVDWKKGLRRYQTSKGWALLPDLREETDLEWEYIKNSAHMWFECYNAKDAGMEIYLSTSPTKKRPVHWLVDWYLGRRKDVIESNKKWHEQKWLKQKIKAEVLQ